MTAQTNLLDEIRVVLFFAIAVAGVLATLSNLPSAQKNRPVYRNYTGRRHQRKR